MSLIEMSAKFLRQKKGGKGAIFYNAKGGIYFRLYCPTNPAPQVFSV
jgi:hypothetical protein